MLPCINDSLGDDDSVDYDGDHDGDHDGGEHEDDDDDDDGDRQLHFADKTGPHSLLFLFRLEKTEIFVAA